MDNIKTHTNGGILGNFFLPISGFSAYPLKLSEKGTVLDAKVGKNRLSKQLWQLKHKKFEMAIYLGILKNKVLNIRFSFFHN